MPGDERGTTPLSLRPLTEPRADRLPPEPLRKLALERHAQAIGLGADTYEDPSTGLFVLTALALARRGRCCGSGCRHCPYDE